MTLRDREIEVGNWPKNAPAELQRVLDTIAEQRRRPPTPSTWELWSRGAVVSLEVGCDVGEVAVLHALDDALFMSTAPPGEAPAGDDPPEDTPLVRVTFSGRDGDDVLSVFADGRRVERTAAGRDERAPPRRRPARRGAPRARGTRTGARCRPGSADPCVAASAVMEELPVGAGRR